MRGFLFWKNLIRLNLGRLCRQRGLLAGLALLCLLLPLCAGPAAEFVLSRGVSFSGVTMAITAPEGDPVPQMVEAVLPSMSDVSRYCQVRAMDYDRAMDALAQGDVHAVLVLPEGFVSGIMSGSNPDVSLYIPSDSPLEGLLLLWVGQSASDLLSAVQNGIYAVLDVYSTTQPEHLHYNDAVTQINLRYVNWTVNRQELFTVQPVAVTQQLPIGQHYALSLLCYLVLALTPFFAVLFDGQKLRLQRRFYAAGRGAVCFYLTALTACWLVIFLLLTAAQLLLIKNSFLQSIGAAALCALFCATFAGLCCLLTANTGSCGLVSFVCSLVFLATAGGIVPPALMPKTLRSLLDVSPISWMRNWMAGNASIQTAMLLVGTALLMLLPGFLLYRRRMLREEDAL